ncbi:MAG: hypothetical protein K9L84_03520 [Candidatus Omnitrophica bacterium]|nr:hypothetical protein [Candidatus Omnitrophota bacterium]MCF7894108.1 hypothetical protein [Candidatus Omnitrophota bacterium]
MKLLKLFLAFVFVFITFIGLDKKNAEAQAQPGGSTSQSKKQKSSSVAVPKKKKEITEQTPLMEIKRLEKEEPEYSIELRRVPLQDFFRLVAHDYDLNIIVDQKVEGEITASLTNVSLEEALDIIVEQKGLALEKKGKIITVKPSLVTKIIPLKNATVSSILEEDDSKTSKGKTTSGGTQTAKTQKTQATSQTPQLIAARGSRGDIYDLLSSYGKIIPNKSTNSLVVIDYPSYVEQVENFVNLIDQKLTTRVFKIDYISVKQLFPKLLEKERQERKLQREEREEEREEIEGIKESE